MTENKKPTCYVIAGPNGAGKTTFAMKYLPGIAGCNNYINADLIAYGISPERKGLTWREFLARHKDVFLSSDFFTKEIWTFHGLETVYVFFVIHLASRKMVYYNATFSPNTEWLKQQARQMMRVCEEQGIKPRFFLHDNGFSDLFDEHVRDLPITPLRTPIKAPNANSVAERYVLNVKLECLNHLIVFGMKHLLKILEVHADFYNQHRPHQGIDNTIPCEYYCNKSNIKADCYNRPSKIGCKEFLGGLLKSYYRKAA